MITNRAVNLVFMQGSVKRDAVRGTWSYVVDLPPGPDNKRRQKMKRGFPTRKAAQDALAEVIGRVNRGTHSEPGRRRLSEYLL